MRVTAIQVMTASQTAWKMFHFNLSKIFHFNYTDMAEDDRNMEFLMSESQVQEFLINRNILQHVFGILHFSHIESFLQQDSRPVDRDKPHGLITVNSSLNLSLG